jgi:hypothetical protein
VLTPLTLIQQKIKPHLILAALILGLVTAHGIIHAAGFPQTANTASPPDLRFLLHTRAGLTAHTTLTDTVPLDLVQPLFTDVEVETDAYLLGTYQLAGRTDTVQLVIGQRGWIIAYHPNDRHIGWMYDCYADSLTLSQPEIAVQEVLDALELPVVDPKMYDFRYPDADYITQHWLYMLKNDNLQSTLTLPLQNTYLERAYAFCTVLSNSKFYINDELIDEQGAITEVIFRKGLLDATQLRAGQENVLRTEARSLFNSGFLGGVSLTYTGTLTVPTQGGERRDLALVYPTMLGEPLEIQTLYLPLIHD